MLARDFLISVDLYQFLSFCFFDHAAIIPPIKTIDLECFCNDFAVSWYIYLNFNMRKLSNICNYRKFLFLYINCVESYSEFFCLIWLCIVFLIFLDDIAPHHFQIYFLWLFLVHDIWILFNNFKNLRGLIHVCRIINWNLTIN